MVKNVKIVKKESLDKKSDGNKINEKAPKYAHSLKNTLEKNKPYHYFFLTIK